MSIFITKIFPFCSRTERPIRRHPGEYLELEPPKKVVQKWRLTGGSGWAEGKDPLVHAPFLRKDRFSTCSLLC